MDESLEDLYERAPCGYLSTDLDGTIVRVNQTFLELVGLARSEVVGRTWLSLLVGGARIFHETHYAPLLRMQGWVREIAVDLVHADGSRLPVLVNSVLHEELGVVRTVVFSATDRREYERELLRERERAIKSEARARLLAQTLQQSFIPPALPDVPGLDLAGVYRPAGVGDEVGGDFYDVFATGDGAWVIVLGDVCGKGAAAAAVTAMARYTLRAAAMQSTSPGVVLATLHHILARSEFDRFATVVYARVEGRVLTVSSGGHPMPLRVVAATGEVEAVGRPGSLLGVLDLELPPSDMTVTLAPGDVLAFFTDGVTEARDAAGFFGESGLREVLAASAGEGASAAEIARAVLDAVVSFQGGVARDDIAIVVVKVPPT